MSYDPISGNQYYGRIRAHGTPNALEPGYIHSSGGTTTTTSTQSVNSLNVNVDISGLEPSATGWFNLGPAIQPGSVITKASVNGFQGVSPGTTTTYQVMLGDGVTPSPGVLPLTKKLDTHTGDLTVAAPAGVPVPGTFTNAGTLLNGGVSNLVGTAVDDTNVFPVLEYVTDVIATTDTGILNVKLEWTSPTV